MAADLPTLYEYYTTDGITNGLSANQPYFTLNNKNVTIYSGAMHYFRIPKPYWRDRLRKLKTAGLNTVETYVPWNLHEPHSGQYDFGKGGSDFEYFLDVKSFLEIAQEEDLFAIVRPGPFICAEWEFGGLPSWLLRDENMKFRVSEGPFMKYVTRYFNILIPILALLQFTNGGPIIAFQVENEYGLTDKGGNYIVDKTYLRQLQQIMLKNGIVELLVTSDSITKNGAVGTILEDFLHTANFQNNPKQEFDALEELQPNKPVMAMEFWSGWFDHWSEKHHTLNVRKFRRNLEYILERNASVNIYMFHGGTNFGFMNGANWKNNASNNSGYRPDTSSYDYDALLMENGMYSPKYYVIKTLLAKYNSVKTKPVDLPMLHKSKAYYPVAIQGQISFEEMLGKVPDSFQSEDVISMEHMPMNNGSGQSYGYIVYRKKLMNIPNQATLMIPGHIYDTVLVLVNGVLISNPLDKPNDLNKFGYWRRENASILLTQRDLTNATLDLVVENWGRISVGFLDQFYQFKGLWQGVYLNNERLFNWRIFPLEFKKSWNNAISGWKPFQPDTIGPTLYRASLKLDKPSDTFLDMQNWTKGIVIVNGFVVGRYAKIGPQQTLYLPAPFLKSGCNEIVVFEHFVPSTEVKFSDKIIFKTL